MIDTLWNIAPLFPLFYAVYCALRFELNDVRCRSIYGDGPCGGLNGAPFRYYVINEDDDIDGAQDKLRRCGEASQSLVTWRRSLFSAALIVGALWVIAKRCDPMHWIDVYTEVIAVLLILYGIMNFYNVHVYNRQSELVKHNVDAYLEMTK
jgi:hypothetical protein